MIVCDLHMQTHAQYYLKTISLLCDSKIIFPLVFSCIYCISVGRAAAVYLYTNTPMRVAAIQLSCKAFYFYTQNDHFHKLLLVIFKWFLGALNQSYSQIVATFDGVKECVCIRSRD